jgi:glutathione reductase (NADPH)
LDNFDLIVIGGGSGGVRAARMAATLGFSVAIIEDTHWGGTCVNVGCVPKKLMVYASHYAHEFEDARSYGWQVEAGEFNWQHFMQKKDAEIGRLNGIYVRLLENSGVKVIDGRGHISGPNTVVVGDQTYSADRILIAVGGKPFMPNLPGSEHCISSDQIFFLPEQPKSVVMVGGGFIALEFACILAGMGTKVTLLYRGELFLRGFDKDVREKMVPAIRDLGIDLRLSSDIDHIDLNDVGQRVVSVNDGTEIVADQVFFATGRIPRTEGLWADSLQINTDKSGAVLVDDNFESSEPSIFALGDVVGRLALTPVATAEAMAMVDYWIEGKAVDIDYSIIPAAVFTQPNVSTVGMTEDQAIEQSVPVKIFEADFKHMKHSLTGRDDRIFMKMLVHAETDKVLGLHAIGPDVGEMIQAAAVAITAGATKAHFDRTIGIHPTMAEELVTMRTERAS